jgi:hypothetical protein
MAEVKTVREWCVSCCFERLKDGNYKVTKNVPKPMDCLQCIYDMVADVKITKPKNWRK